MNEVRGGFYDITNNSNMPGVFADRQIEIGSSDTVYLDPAAHSRLSRAGYTISPNDDVDSAYDLFGVNHKRDDTGEGISDAPVMMTRDNLSINSGTHLRSTMGVNVNAFNAANAGWAGMSVEEAEKVNSDITGEQRMIGDPAFTLEDEGNKKMSEPGKNAGGKELERQHKERMKAAKELPSQSPQLAAIDAAASKHYEEPEQNLVKDENKSEKKTSEKKSEKDDKDSKDKSDKSDKSKDENKDDKSDANKTSQEAPNNIGKTPADDNSTINSQITPGNVGQVPQTTDPSARPTKPSHNHPANVNMP